MDSQVCLSHLYLFSLPLHTYNIFLETTTMASVLSPTRWLHLATTALLLSTNPAASFSSCSVSSSSSSRPSSSTLSVASTPPQETSTSYDTVKVDLSNGRDYPIYIGSDFTDKEAAALLRKHIHGKRVLLITNDRIAPLYLERYQQLLADNSVDDKELVVDTVVVPDGEENKSYDVMAMVLDKALELGLDRKSTFVALGGGVIGDMVGFASAIYQRGVNFVQEQHMEKLLERDPDATRYAIRRSCENKAEVVQADELEAGVRATLNLGHTFGHAIENGSGYGTWLHGEGVSIGTAMAATMSEKMGWIDE
eukprot:scaffold2049_cov134-Skeletonema_menzelii.AAC.7